MKTQGLQASRRSGVPVEGRRRDGAGVCSVVALTVVLFSCAGCSPEDGRARGGGRGADIGNRGEQVTPPGKFAGADPAGRVYRHEGTGMRPRYDARPGVGRGADR